MKTTSTRLWPQSLYDIKIAQDPPPIHSSIHPSIHQSINPARLTARFFFPFPPEPA
jgi:hypothetical protein